MTRPDLVLYCHCAYSEFIPPDVKREVLRRLSGSGVAVEAVSDLCGLAADGDRDLDGAALGIDHGADAVDLAKVLAVAE